MNKYHVMTLIVGLLTVCFSSNATLTVYAAESVSLSNVNSESQTESIDNFDLALYHQLETYVYKQKADGNLAFQWVYVLQPYYFADENGNIPEEFQNKVIIRYYSFEEEFLPQMQAFIQENSIDEGMVAYNVLDDDTKCRPSEELVTAFTLLKQFVDEQTEDKNPVFHSASVWYYCLESDDDGNVPDFFQNKIVVTFYEFKQDEFMPLIRAFMQENDIEEDIVAYSMLLSEEPDIEPAQDDKEVLSDETLCEWASKDYQDKTSTAVKAEIAEKSDEAYEISLTDEGGNVLDTYKVNPQTGIGSDSAGTEVNLPQTGINDRIPLVLILCALLSVAGGWLIIRKSDIVQLRKER